ncbi:glutamate receptor U1 isoform X2 [Eurytemora carolleeae]|uniref:glutamate receptor U1 isoform X2 n=1 Tax=Eurytemora carolleeae TaxID=1294199 RepID=UPI000C78639E|nr:glutamate receptor U1 isoform X2 [Eurytemora carolleeae]|eukprot:XP_023326038.1 glutamate receptor U1-like isoform X2 [Eurytemora affinis]
MEGFGPPTIQMQFTGEKTVIRNQTLSIINSSEKYQLQTIFKNGYDAPGTFNPRTGKWQGVIGMVGYDEVDLGVGAYARTVERSTFVEFTFVLHTPEYNGWVTKYPEKTAASENLSKVFDKYTWIAILISVISTSIAMLVVSKVLKNLGFKQPDSVIVSLIAFSLLNAEGMPDWFLISKKRVYSGSIMLMTWALACSLLTFGFSSNLRAILLSPSYEPFMDSSFQIAERGMTLVWNTKYNAILDYMRSSPNPSVSEIMKTIVYVTSEDDVSEIIAEKGLKNLVFYTNELIPDIPFKEYESKEVISSKGSGHVIQKNSKWQEIIEYHILIGLQASFETFVKRKTNDLFIESKVEKEEMDELEKLKINHLASAFIILGVGLGISTLGKNGFLF